MRVGVALAAVLAVCGLSLPVGASESNELIWPRLVRDMRLVDDQQPDVAAWARRYAHNAGAFSQMLARSEPYLWHIVEAVEQRNMPAEIALLPAIESGFDPYAQSSQKAHGLWQLVPWTGKAMGLQSTRDYEGRRDPLASTHAALGHLSDLHERFGDWHIALAAYNTGAGRMAALLREQPHTRDFWALKLPPETHAHVRRLLGVAALVEKPARYGVQLPDIRNHRATELVRLREPVDLGRAAEAARIPESVVRHYNPGLSNLHNTTGKKLVVLPAAEAGRLRAALASRRFAAQPVPTRVVHVVQPGDSLWRIARRYAVAVGELAEWNGITEKTPIRPGHRLEVMIDS